MPAAPSRIKVSYGTALELGLKSGRMDAKPTTAYLLTPFPCYMGCKFCDQNQEKRMLSRIPWPDYPIEEVISRLKNSAFKRLCIQTVYNPDIFEQIEYIIPRADIPISLSGQFDRKRIRELEKAGIDRLCIPLDAATQAIHARMKNSSWKSCIERLSYASDIFKERVTTHLIVGLGETEENLVDTIDLLTRKRIEIALFAFTPIKGTLLEKIQPPSLETFRKIQLARYLIKKGMIQKKDIQFEDSKIINFGLPLEELLEIVGNGEIFHTSGCPYCNRPFYNEHPRGPLYSYPRPLTKREVSKEREFLANILFKNLENPLCKAN